MEQIEMRPAHSLQPIKSDRERFRSLDGLRGLAALLVVQRHFVLAIQDLHRPILSADRPGLAALDRIVRYILFGPTVVPVFFVLSGFVLALSYMKPNPAPLGSFLIKRIARLWLPFAVVILFAALAQRLLAFHDDPTSMEWLRSSWHRPAHFGDIARHLLLTGQEFWLDNPTWTLSHELRLSMIFPALVSLTLRNAWMSLLLSSGISVLATATFVLFPAQTSIPSVAASLLSTLQYMFLFVIGIFVATRHEAVSSFIFKLGRSTKLLLWILAIAGVYANPLMDKALTDFWLLSRLVVGGFASSLLLILCSTEGRGFRSLRSPLPMYISKISYSLYLLHVVTIVIIFRSNALIRYGVGAKLIIALVLSFIFAHLLQRFVETPCAQLGRRLAKRFAHSFSRAEVLKMT